MSDPTPFAPESGPGSGGPQPAGEPTSVDLRALYEATAPRLLGVCVRILGDVAQAEEAAAEAYAAAARHPIEGDPFAWLCAVARGRAIERLRARGDAPGEPEPAEDLIPAAPSVALRRLQAALRELTPLQAASIQAAYLDGADYPALARRAAVPLGTLKSGVRRGLLRLQERLEA